MMKPYWRVAVQCIALLTSTSCVSSAFAGQSLQQLSQYGHRSWRVQDGTLPVPSSIAQTTDGYIWIGTETGLLRFDGIRFVEANVFGNDSLQGSRVLALLGSHDGSLWIGGSGFVARLKEGRLERFPVEGRVSQIVSGNAGTIWFVQQGASVQGKAAVCSIAGDTLACHGKPELPLDSAGSISNATDGLWVGSSFSLCHWIPGRQASCFLEKALEPFNNLIGVTASLALPNDVVWVGFGNAGPNLGLGQLSKGQWIPFKTSSLDGSSLPVSMMVADREGSIWVGTLGRGLYRIHDGVSERFGVADGLSSDTVDGNFLEDREGTMWVTTSGGVDSFRRLPVSVYSEKQGIASDRVHGVLGAADGTMWLTGGQLTTIVDNHVTALPAVLQFVQHASSLLQDHRGRIWFSEKNTLQVFDKDSVKQIVDHENLPVGAVQDMAEDINGDVYALTVGTKARMVRIANDTIVEDSPRRVNDDALVVVRSAPGTGVWFGYLKGKLIHVENGHQEIFPAGQADGTAIVDMAVDARDRILAATKSGLIVQRKSERQRLDKSRGLPCEQIHTVVRDAHETVYLGADCGIVVIESAELDRWFAHPDTKIKSRLLDETDGVQTGSPYFSPHAAKGTDGRVWLANGRVAEVIDPSTIDPSRPDPPLRIEEVIADRTSMPVHSPLTLTAKTRDIAIRYTALSFVAPQKILFQYRLDGRDAAWSDAGTRREAFYTDLPPGSYRFHVRAADEDGTWGVDGATLDFAIPALFYQTRWFLAVCIGLAILVLYAFYLDRLRRVAAAVGERAAIKNEERARLARDLHDTLLQSTQGLILRFQQAAGRIPPSEPARQLMERALDRADEVLAESRNHVHELHSHADARVDVLAALELAICELGELDSSSRLTLAVRGEARTLNGWVGFEVIKILREALGNAVTHAKATTIQANVTFTASGLRVSIVDDGIGIADAVRTAGKAGHWGLASMRQRAAAIGARLRLRNRTEGGTAVELFVPASAAFGKDGYTAESWWRRLFRRRPPMES